MYTTTIRIRRKEDIDMIERAKLEFCPTSLSSALVLLVREYYRLKKRDDLMHQALKRKLEIPTKLLEELF
jgi:hypothetical protein